jgi:hypothetical protein
MLTEASIQKKYFKQLSKVKEFKAIEKLLMYLYEIEEAKERSQQNNNNLAPINPYQGKVISFQTVSDDVVRYVQEMKDNPNIIEAITHIIHALLQQEELLPDDANQLREGIEVIINWYAAAEKAESIKNISNNFPEIITDTLLKQIFNYRVTHNIRLEDSETDLIEKKLAFYLGSNNNTVSKKSQLLQQLFHLQISPLSFKKIFNNKLICDEIIEVIAPHYQTYFSTETVFNTFYNANRKFLTLSGVKSCKAIALQEHCIDDYYKILSYSSSYDNLDLTQVRSLLDFLNNEALELLKKSQNNRLSGNELAFLKYHSNNIVLIKNSGNKALDFVTAQDFKIAAAIYLKFPSNFEQGDKNFKFKENLSLLPFYKIYQYIINDKNTESFQQKLNHFAQLMLELQNNLNTDPATTISNSLNQLTNNDSEYRNAHDDLKAFFDKSNKPISINNNNQIVSDSDTFKFYITVFQSILNSNAKLASEYKEAYFASQFSAKISSERYPFYAALHNLYQVFISSNTQLQRRKAIDFCIAESEINKNSSLASDAFKQLISLYFTEKNQVNLNKIQKTNNDKFNEALEIVKKTSFSQDEFSLFIQDLKNLGHYDDNKNIISFIFKPKAFNNPIDSRCLHVHHEICLSENNDLNCAVENYINNNVNNINIISHINHIAHVQISL